MRRKLKRFADKLFGPNVVLPALIVALITIGMWGHVPKPDEPKRSPLPELDGALVVVYVNCGLVTDILAVDRNGWIEIGPSMLSGETGYESTRHLVETMKENDQAWAVRETSDCEDTRL